MSVPVVLKFLAETDDLLRQVNQVKSSVNEMVTGAGQTLSAVEAIVNRAIASTNTAVEQVHESVSEAVASTEAISTMVEQAVARAIAGANANVVSARGVIDQTVAAADAAVAGVSSSVGSVRGVIDQTVAAADAAVAGASRSVRSVHGVIDETVAAANAAVTSVDQVTLHAQNTILGRFQDLNQAARTIIDEIRSTGEHAADAVSPLLRGSRESLEATERQVRAISAAGVVGFGLLGASTAAAASSALQAARQYEDLQARLRGLTSSAEEANTVFREAVAMAASTPFEVTEIVSATSTLQAFGQNTKENMIAVGEIAAATGAKLEETALRMAKALAGTSEGFQGLRDVSGITAQRLAKYGAVLADASNVSLKGEVNIKKATKALQELARVEFAGNMDKQSASFSGAISNAEDAIMTLRATLGEGLIPIATLSARTVASLADTATSLVASVQGAIPYVAGFAMGVSALGTAAFTLAGTLAAPIARVIVMQGVLRAAELALGKAGLSLGMFSEKAMNLAMKNDLAAQAIVKMQERASVLVGWMRNLGASATQTTSKLTGLSSGAVLGGFAALSAAAVVAYIAIDKMESNAIAAGKAIVKLSRDSVFAAQGFREVAHMFEEVSGKSLEFGADARETSQAVRAGLEGISDSEIMNRIAATGHSLADLEAMLRNSAAASDVAKRKIKDLEKEVADMEGTAALKAALSILKEDPDASLSMAAQGQIDKYNKLTKALEAANFEHKELGNTMAGLRVFIERVSQIDPALANVERAAKSLDSYLKFANGLESVGKLQGALKVVEGNIAEMQASLMTAFGTIDRFELGAKLADPVVAGNKAAVEAIEKYLERLNDRDKLQEKSAKLTEEQSRKEIAAHEAVTARKKVLGELTLQQERARIAQQLTMVKEGSDQETKILEQLASKDEEIRRKREEMVKASLDRQLRVVEESVDRISSAPDSSAEQVSAALRNAIASMERFGQANKVAFAGAPEAAEQFRQKLVGLRNELSKSEGKELAENLQKLKSTLDKGIDSGGTTVQQLVQVGEAITNLKAAMAAKSVEQGGAEEYLATLEEKKLDLIRKQTAEKLKQVDEIAALQRQALDGEIEILEARLAAGENVERQLMEARRQRTQLELEQIDEVTQREIEAGGDRVLAEQKNALAKEAIYKKDALEKYKASQPPRDQARQQRRGSQQNSSARAFANEIVENSPFSQNSLFSGVNASQMPLFSSGFGERLLRNRSIPQAPRFDNVVRQARQEQDNYRRQLQRQDDKAKSAQTIYNTTVNVSGGSADPDAKALARQAEQVARNKARQDSLMGRSAKPSSPYGPLQQ